MLPDWWASELIVFMYYIRILIVLPWMPTCDVLLHHFRKCCHTCADTQLPTLISYVLLVHSNARFSVEDTNAHLKPVVCFVLPVYTNGRWKSCWRGRAESKGLLLISPPARVNKHTHTTRNLSVTNRQSMQFTVQQPKAVISNNTLVRFGLHVNHNL